MQALEKTRGVEVSRPRSVKTDELKDDDLDEPCRPKECEAWKLSGGVSTAGLCAWQGGSAICSLRQGSEPKDGGAALRYVA